MTATATRETREEAARVALRETLQEENPYRVRSFGSMRLRQEGEKVAENGEAFDQMFVASTEALASDGGVIYADGWRFEQYRKNPVFISLHDISGFKHTDMTRISAGKGVWFGVKRNLPMDVAPISGKALLVAVRFAPTAFGREMNLLYGEGFLNAVSVRWDMQTEVVRNPFEEEVMKYGDDLLWVAERTDLLELSSVILGADDFALAKRAQERGDTCASRVQVSDEVKAAFTRCRQKGIELPEMAKLIRAAEQSLPVRIGDDLEEIVNEPTENGEGEGREEIEATTDEPEEEAREEEEVEASEGEDEGEDEEREGDTPDGDREVDSAALSDVVSSFDETLEGLDAWLDQGQSLRQNLSDVRAEIGALLTSDSADADESGGDEDDEDRSDEPDERSDSSRLDAIEQMLDQMSRNLANAIALAEAEGDEGEGRSSEEEDDEEADPERVEGDDDDEEEADKPVRVKLNRIFSGDSDRTTEEEEDDA